MFSPVEKNIYSSDFFHGKMLNKNKRMKNNFSKCLCSAMIRIFFETKTGKFRERKMECFISMFSNIVRENAFIFSTKTLNLEKESPWEILKIKLCWHSDLRQFRVEKNFKKNYRCIIKNIKFASLIISNTYKYIIIVRIFIDVYTFFITFACEKFRLAIKLFPSIYHRTTWLKKLLNFSLIWTKT